MPRPIFCMTFLKWVYILFLGSYFVYISPWGVGNKLSKGVITSINFFNNIIIQNEKKYIT